jgi:hypothetical protein
MGRVLGSVLRSPESGPCSQAPLKRPSATEVQNKVAARAARTIKDLTSEKQSTC